MQYVDLCIQVTLTSTLQMFQLWRFIMVFIYVLPLEIVFLPNTRLNSKVRVCNISRVGNLDPINHYNSAIFCIQSQDFEFQPHMWCLVVPCCVQWVKVRGDCMFCWYWWYCWPLSFHIFFLFVINRYIHVLFVFEWQLIYTVFFLLFIYICKVFGDEIVKKIEFWSSQPV